MNKTFPKTYKEVKDWFSYKVWDTFSLDIETDGLGYDCQLKGISLCDGVFSCYINLENNPESKRIIGLFQRNLSYCNLIIGHNLAFDLRVLKQYGINYTGEIYDTMVASHLLNENVSCALKDIVKRKKFNGWETAIEFKEAVINGYSSQKFLNYAINDSIWTWQLYELTKPLLTEQGLDKLFYEIETPFQFVLIDMYLNGIKVDTKKLEEFDDILTAEKGIAEMDCIKSIGLKMKEEKNLWEFTTISSPINLNSSQQLAKIIEGKLGLELPKTEPSDMYPDGQASTSADVLKPLKNKHSFIKQLLRYRKAEKLLNTFIQPLYEKIDKDGRLRTNYNNCIPRSGRLSSSEPNLQNIPKELDETDIVNIRELFIAEQGKCFIRADYDLQEIRQLANITNDNTLIYSLNSGQDIHLVSANGCLNLGLSEKEMTKLDPYYKEIKEKYKKERHIGKNGINFPVIYGSTAYGVALNNNVSEEEAQKWIDGFFKMYPDVKKSIKKCKNELFRNHCVRNYFGRKRRFGEITPKAIRQAFNFWIQGMCADLLRKTMNSLHYCYLQNPQWKAKLVMTVHDDIITECSEEYANEVLEVKKKIMENTVNLPVKFLVDIKKCYSYGD